MSTWTNILNLIYPVGTTYISKSSTSPATLFGGTWTQVKGALLGATGANSFASAGKNGGSLKIAKTQLPQHAHNIRYNLSGTNTTYDSSWGNSGTGIYQGTDVSISNTVKETTMWMYNNLRTGSAKVTDGDISYYGASTTSNWISPLYAQKLVSPSGSNFLPYHYGVYVWYRTA